MYGKQFIPLKRASADLMVPGITAILPLGHHQDSGRNFMYPLLGLRETVAMGVIRSIFFIALALALSACAAEKYPYQIFLNKTCVAETAKNQNPVNWNLAKVQNIAIRDGVYNPNETYMKVGEPTILRITNNDKDPRLFIDGEFLDSVALAQLSVGSVKFDRPCTYGVVIDAGEKAEFRLVPLTAGIYHPKDNLFWILGFQQSPLGFIYVED